MRIVEANRLAALLALLIAADPQVQCFSFGGEFIFPRRPAEKRRRFGIIRDMDNVVVDNFDDAPHGAGAVKKGAENGLSFGEQPYRVLLGDAFGRLRYGAANGGTK